MDCELKVATSGNGNASSRPPLGFVFDCFPEVYNAFNINIVENVTVSNLAQREFVVIALNKSKKRILGH